MKLYIIRHGETPWNAEGRLQGQTDIPLNENGIRLAKITGEALKDVPFDFAISSPLKRARHFYKDPFHFQTAADGETIEQLCVRTKAFWDDLVNNPDWQDKTILIASHGCACRGILHNVYEDKTDFWHGKVPPNCAVNIVSAEDGKAVLEAEDKIYYDPAECVDFRTGKKASQTGKAAQTR